MSLKPLEGEPRPRRRYNPQQCDTENGLGLAILKTCCMTRHTRTLFNNSTAKAINARFFYAQQCMYILPQAPVYCKHNKYINKYTLNSHLPRHHIEPVLSRSVPLSIRTPPTEKGNAEKKKNLMSLG